jgi:hypothetical protein
MLRDSLGEYTATTSQAVSGQVPPSAAPIQLEAASRSAAFIPFRCQAVQVHVTLRPIYVSNVITLLCLAAITGQAVHGRRRDQRPAGSSSAQRFGGALPKSYEPDRLPADDAA